MERCQVRKLLAVIEDERVSSDDEHLGVFVNEPTQIYRILAGPMAAVGRFR